MESSAVMAAEGDDTDALLRHIRYQHQQLIEELMRCVICSKVHTDPKVLPCYHTICVDCLLKHANARRQPFDLSPPSAVECPVCAYRIRWPNGGLNNLPTNFHVLALVDANDYANKTPILCDICNQKPRVRKVNAAKVACVECKRNLCQSCSCIHDNFPEMKSHHPRDVTRNISTTDALDACPLHPTQPLTLFCKLCTTEVCDICLCEYHDDHPFREVDENRKCEKLKGFLQLFSDTVGVLLSNCETQLQALHSRFNAKAADGTSSSSSSELSASNVDERLKTFMMQRESAVFGRTIMVLEGFVRYCDMVRTLGKYRIMANMFGKLQRTSVQLVLYELDEKFNKMMSESWAHGQDATTGSKIVDNRQSRAVAEFPTNTESVETLLSAEVRACSLANTEIGTGSAADALNVLLAVDVNRINVEQPGESRLLRLMGSIPKDPVGAPAQDQSQRTNEQSRPTGIENIMPATSTADNANVFEYQKQRREKCLVMQTGSDLDRQRVITDLKEKYSTLSAKLITQLSPCKAISVAVLLDETYVLANFAPLIDVFDSRSFLYRRKLHLKELQADWLCVAACPKLDRLFLSGCRPNIVCRLITKPTLQWEAKWTPDGSPNTMSVTADCHVIVVDRSDHFTVYDPDGLVVRVVQPIKAGLGVILSAAMLVDGRFVTLQAQTIDNRYSMLEKWDASGQRQLAVYGTPARCKYGGMMEGPTGLAVDTSFGFVLVCDMMNDRIMMFDPDLVCISPDIVRTTDEKTHSPSNIVWDCENGTLYVWQFGGWVRAYNVMV